MNFLYDVFLTKKNLSSKDLEDISNVFQYTSSKSTSILEKYKEDIKIYIETNKIDLKKFNKTKNFYKNNILNKLSKFYNNFFINNGKIKLFFYYLIESKIIMNKSITNISSFNNLFNHFNKKIIKNYSNHELFYNPLGYNSPFSFNIKNNLRNFNTQILNLKNFSKFNKNFNNINNISHLKISLDILTQSNIINISLPSIGILTNYFSSSKESYSYIGLIEKIIKLKDTDNNDISKFIPLKYLDLGTNISNMLFDVTNNNSDYNMMKKNFKNTINSININLEDIFIESKKENSKTHKKIKYEFVIPYKIDNSKKDEIVSCAKNDIDKIKTIKDLITKNNNIVNNVLLKINQEKNNISKLLDTNNVKNVLCCYLFYIINLVYTISKLYIDKIDYFLFDIVNSKDKRYGSLDIKKAFEYTTLLKRSLYKFRRILLNNFYYMFSSLNFLTGNYGMKINELGCYIPDGKILQINEDLLDAYPFYSYNSSSNEQDFITFDKNKLSKFILYNKSNVDIYDKNIILEIGGNSFDFFTLKNSLSILSNYYQNIDKYNKFNLFVIQLLINNFIEKNIPIELLEKIDSILYSIKFNKAEFERKIILKYENNMDKAIDFLTSVIQIREKIKNSKKTDIDYLKNIETINLCSFNIYFLRSQGLINTVKNINIDINFKNLLLEKLLKRKKDYELTIKK